MQSRAVQVKREECQGKSAMYLPIDRKLQYDYNAVDFAELVNR